MMNWVERLIFGGWRLISLLIQFSPILPISQQHSLKRKFIDIEKPTLRRNNSYQYGLYIEMNEDNMIVKKRKISKSYGHFVFIDEMHLAKGDDFEDLFLKF
jgi:hypothetical protein